MFTQYNINTYTHARAYTHTCMHACTHIIDGLMLEVISHFFNASHSEWYGNKLWHAYIHSITNCQLTMQHIFLSLKSCDQKISTYLMSCDLCKCSNCISVVQAIWMNIHTMQGCSRQSDWSGFGRTTTFQGKKQNSILQKASDKQKYKCNFRTCIACYTTIQQIEKGYDEVENNCPPTHTNYFKQHKVAKLLCKN